MPLQQGNSRLAVSQNIKTELAAGKPQTQAIAIALHTADESQSKNIAHKPHHGRGRKGAHVLRRSGDA